MSIADRLTELRERQGKTQEAVAEACNISRVTLARYENGTREPVAKNVSKIAQYYGVTVDYLLGREDPQAYPALVVDISSGLASGETEEQAINDGLLSKLDSLSHEDRRIIEEHIDFLLSRKRRE